VKVKSKVKVKVREVREGKVGVSLATCRGSSVTGNNETKKMAMRLYCNSIDDGKEDELR